MHAADNGLDAAGFIRQVPELPFQHEYQAVLTAVRSQLPALLGAHLVALYVYGSVAEGRARPAQSDLDLTLILSDACPSTQVNELEHLRRTLELGYPEVSKIDFDLGRRAEALASANRLSWGSGSSIIVAGCGAKIWRGVLPPLSRRRPSLKR